MTSLYQRTTILPAVNRTPESNIPVKYVGFSTQDPTSTTFKLYDIDLIKTDILNHFSIRRGTKLMNPLYGTIIWDLIFEPYTDVIKQKIINDVTMILQSESRIRASNIVINPNYTTGSLEISFVLTVIQTNVAQQIQLTFDQQTGTVTI